MNPMKSNLSALRAARPLVLTLAVALLAGCGSGAVSLATEEASSPTTSSPAPPELTPTSSSVATTANSTPQATATGPSSSDVAAAVRSALGLFEKVPRNPTDAAAGYVWRPASDSTGHLSSQVAARLAALQSTGYFSGRVCAEDYLTGTQNGLPAAPTVVTAHGDAGGTVTVVIRRPATPAPPDLTAVMTRHNGIWLANDLASGSGPSASIFAAKPHC
jgi:hypothetical protein